MPAPSPSAYPGPEVSCPWRSASQASRIRPAAPLALPGLHFHTAGHGLLSLHNSVRSRLLIINLLYIYEFLH